MAVRFRKHPCSQSRGVAFAAPCKLDDADGHDLTGGAPPARFRAAQTSPSALDMVSMISGLKAPFSRGEIQ